MTDDLKSNARKFEMSIDIDASQEDVWKAFTDANELVRWFPLQASVEPGVGGSVRMGWGDAWAGVMRIDAWNPPKLLRLIDESARPFDADGGTVGGAAPARVAVEVTLETVDGKTRLRLVHSGFGTGAAWDDEVEGISTGWQFELRNLRHYLTRHRGRARYAAFAHGSAPLTVPDMWARIVNDSRIAVSAPKLEAGQPYTATLSTGDRFSGRIQLYIPHREFAGTAAELGDGIFRVCTYPAGGRAGTTLWVETWEERAAEMNALGDRLRGMLDDVCAAERSA